MKLHIYVCILFVSCSSTKIIHERTNSISYCNEFLEVPIESFLGKEVNVFVDALSKGYDKLLFTNGRPGVISSAIFGMKDDNDSFFVIKMKRTKNLNQINFNFDWTINDIENEMINEIKFIDKNGVIIHLKKDK